MVTRSATTIPNRNPKGAARRQMSPDTGDLFEHSSRLNVDATTRDSAGVEVSALPPSDGREPEAPHLRYLLPQELPMWDALVDSSPQGSVFTRSWWLKAVGGTVQMLGYFKGGQLVAGIPLYSEKRLGMAVFSMPKLTQTLGPILLPTNAKRHTAISDEMTCLTAFATEIANRRVPFFQAFHSSLQNWSPFYWKGFSQTSRATMTIDLTVPVSELWDQLAHRARRNINKATREGVRISRCGPDVLWQVEAKTFEKQHMRVPHSLDYLHSLYRAARDNDAGECFAASDDLGRIHSACFLLWDQKRAYLIATGADPALRSSGAESMLVWHAIEFAASRSPILDFTGSMLPAVEPFLRCFGTTQVPYSWIMRFPRLLKAGLVLAGKI